MVVRRSSGAKPSFSSQEESRVQVPKLNTDPVWSLRPWPVEIEVAGTAIEVPPLCATDWLFYLMQETPDLDTLARDIIPDLEDLLYEDALDMEEFYRTLLEVVSCVSAHPWWVTMRLISVARYQWDILGPELLQRGANPNLISLALWLDVLLITILSSMDAKKTTLFVMQLEAVPDLVKDPKKDAFDDMEMDTGAFLSLGR